MLEFSDLHYDILCHTASLCSLRRLFVLFSNTKTVCKPSQWTVINPDLNLDYIVCDIVVDE